MTIRGWANRTTWWAAWFTLLLALVLTALAWRVADAQARREAHVALQSQVNAIASRIEERVLAYEQLLRGGAGLFAAVQDVDRAQWRAFVDALGLAALPGIEGIGYTRLLRPDELDEHVEAVRAEGLRGYQVFPPGPRDLYSAVTFLEPLHTRNLRALGYDMYAEAIRRQAMEQARDTGEPSLTGRVVLVQEGEQPRQAGFLLYLPVYRQNAVLDTIAQRREALEGWVYAPFRAQDFMRGLFGDAPQAVQIRIRDRLQGGATMYESAGPEAAPVSTAMLNVPLRMADRVWELGITANAVSNAGVQHGPTLVALGGLLISLLIFAIVRTLAGTRSQAIAIADRMTEALRQAKESLEDRVHERTVSLRESNERLGRVNAKLQTMTATLGAINAPEPLARKVRTIAAQARTLVDCDLALTVMRGTEQREFETFIGLDTADPSAATEIERWRRAAMSADIEGEALASGRVPPGSFEHRIHAPLRDSSGNRRGYLVVGRDRQPFSVEDATVLSQLALLIAGSVSLHETLARERNARAEAERADQAKDEMLAVVSHELRTPLNAIQGWLHVLRRRRSNDAALLDRAVEVIQRNLDTQVQLVDDLLDTARIVTGKLRLELTRLDLVPLLNAAIDVVRPLAEAKQQRIEVEIAEEDFRTVGDPSRLEQVVWNLLTNAVKFTPHGGWIIVRLERLGWLAQLDVEDNGSGIEPAFLPHVFDRFRQADSSNTRNAGGLGLGLALVRHMVEAHGGQVMVRSAGLGGGSCFTVTLPLGTTALDGDLHPAFDADRQNGREAEAEILERFGPRPLQDTHVIVVEDHEDSRELLVDFLASRGAQVHAAGSSAEALARMREIEPGARPILLCDIALPGESGYDLLARIRQSEQAARKPQSEQAIGLALSAFTREEDRQRSLAAGFVAHLTKPISQAELLARIVGIQRNSKNGSLLEGR